MSRYRAAQDVLRAEIDGEEVLLNTRTGVYHLVNRTGRSLLVLMEDGRSLEESVVEVAVREGQDPATVEADAAGFIDAMRERGLLQETE